jgi:hypothetical protein
MRMPQQLGVLLLVSVIAAAPIALTACEIVCAVRDSHQPTGHSAPAGHSCHRTQPTQGPAVDAGVRICGHDETLPAGSQAVLLSMPALAALTPSLVVSPGDASHRSHIVALSPIGPSGPPVPLRI